MPSRNGGSASHNHIVGTVTVSGIRDNTARLSVGIIRLLPVGRWR
jgi:hypothetical protein